MRTRFLPTCRMETRTYTCHLGVKPLNHFLIVMNRNIEFQKRLVKYSSYNIEFVRICPEKCHILFIFIDSNEKYYLLFLCI